MLFDFGADNGVNFRHSEAQPKNLALHFRALDEGEILRASE
jgi:hypothetical protein